MGIKIRNVKNKLATLDEATLRGAGMQGDLVGELLDVCPSNNFIVRILKPEGSKFADFRKVAINGSVLGDEAPPLSIEVRAKEATS